VKQKPRAIPRFTRLIKFEITPSETRLWFSTAEGKSCPIEIDISIVGTVVDHLQKHLAGDREGTLLTLTPTTIGPMTGLGGKALGLTTIEAGTIALDLSDDRMFSQMQSSLTRLASRAAPQDKPN
jgi:hypothetical protein